MRLRIGCRKGLTSGLINSDRLAVSDSLGAALLPTETIPMLVALAYCRQIAICRLQTC